MYFFLTKGMKGMRGLEAFYIESGLWVQAIYMSSDIDVKVEREKKNPCQTWHFSCCIALCAKTNNYQKVQMRPPLYIYTVIYV